MATAQALAPIMAQQFCQSKTMTTSGVAFDLARTAAAASCASSPERRRDPSHRKPAPSSPKGANDIFSLTDGSLAERYQFVEEIGYGNWGSVWMCHPKTTGTPELKIAVKLVHRSKNPTSSARVRSLWTEFKSIRALRDLAHENIIDFHSFIITPSYALISMAHHPRLMPVELPESKARSYFQQLISAVDFLHAHGTTHNDLKPANILLSVEDKPILVDFGFAQQYDVGSKDRFLSSLSWGTPEYLSPERAKGILHDERLSDTWALGVTMYEVVVGRTPFEKTEAEEFLTRDALEVYYHRTTAGSFCGPYKVSPEFESLIHVMVQPNVNLRLQTCGHALRHPFFAQPLQHPRSTHSLVRSLDSPGSATPPRSTPGRSTPGGTPTSSAQKSARKGPKGMKIYQDAESPTLSRVARPISTASHVLAERNVRNSITASMKQTPSKIPVRKADISNPVVLVKKSATPPHNPPAMPESASPPVRKSTTPARTASTSIKSIPPLPRSSPSVTLSRDARESPPPFSALAAAPSSLARPMSSPKVPRKSPARSSPPSKTNVKIVAAKGDEEEVLSDTKHSRSATFASLTGFSRSTSPISPSSGYFSKSSIRAPGGVGSSDDFTSTSFEDLASTDSCAFAVNRTLPLPQVKSSTSLASKLRKLSVRRAPSALTFRGIKSSISHRAHRRASTSSSVFSMIDAEPLNKEDKSNVTMPLSLGRSTAAKGPAPDLAGERERLETFSRHIQHIIDARKQTEPPFPKRSVAPKLAATTNGGFSEMAILSPSEVQEFRQQIAQELADDRRKKNSMSSESQAVGPRTRRSSTLSRGVVSPHVEPVTVKIRPSLAPSFVGRSPPPASPPKRGPSTSTSTGSSFSMLSSAADVDDLTATFKPGHRRIPTACRSVPSILLTSSADDYESESDYDGTRSETPGSMCSERVSSPPPTQIIVEEARQLPVWVPEDLSSDEEDADVDEPTIRIEISTPTKLKRKPSPASPRSPPATMSPSPSSAGLFQQFVDATPGVARRGRAPPRTPVTVAAEPDSRSSSRATTHTTDTQLSRKRSVISFLFNSNSRPTTPSPSLASVSSVSTTDVSDAGPGGGGERKPKRAGKFKRAFKKLLQ